MLIVRLQQGDRDPEDSTLQAHSVTASGGTSQAGGIADGWVSKRCTGNQVQNEDRDHESVI